MTRIRKMRLLLACGVGLAFAPVWAQEESGIATSPGMSEDELTYRELQLREQVAAERRLDIIQMRGEASRLTANTEELNAQAQNCKARRTAYEAGAPVELCKNDRPESPRGETQIAGLAGVPPAEWLAQIEARLAMLENRQFAAPDATNILTDPNTLGPVVQPELPPVLLLTGPARAIVRLPDSDADALFRLPFEAVRAGDDCIETVSSRNRIVAGTRICKQGTEQ